MFYKFLWVPILRKCQICMLKKKSALSYKFVCVATHRCGGGKSSCKSTNVLAIMPVAALGMGVDVDVMMSVCVAPKLPHLAGW